jgi:cyclase
MKRFAIPGTIVVVGLILAWACSPEPALRIDKAADNLFVITGGDAGNTAVFVRAEGVVLVDTKVAGSGQGILDLVRTVTDRPITHILNTHTHFDHVGSNAFFPPHIEVVAHENTAGQMKEMDEFSDPANRHGLPDRTFTDTLALFAGPDAIDLHYFGAAHTNGDAFIVFRSAGVMHAGDTFPGVNVVARNGGSEAEYPNTMSRAAGSITGVHTVIPGHGTMMTWQSFVGNARTLSRGR